jgi:energy-coupling factor transport system permease protein
MQVLYQAHDSFLHRLNPLSKLLVALPQMLLMLLVSEPWTPLAFVALSILVLFTLGRISFQRFLRLLWPLLTIAVLFVALYPFLVRQSLVSDTPLIFQFGPIALYQGGLYLAAVSGLRVLALLTASLPFSLTSDSADFVRALVQQARLPYRIGYSTLAAFRFVPMLQSEMSVVQAAHRVRGVDDRAGWRGTLERLRRSAVPLLTTAIRQAERTALAMDARAFGAYEQRSYFRRMRFGRADWLYVFGGLAVSVGILLALRAAGLLGPLTFLQIL